MEVNRQYLRKSRDEIMIYTKEEMETEIATHTVLINQLQEKLLMILDILEKKGLIENEK